MSMSTKSELTSTMYKNLCRSFLTTRIDYANQQILEVLYAVLTDGTILQSEERPRNNSFAGRKWKPVSELPEHAEFIGNYPSPKLEE